MFQLFEIFLDSVVTIHNLQDTTLPNINGTRLKITCPNARAAEVVKQWIIGNSSMPFSGYCVPVPPGGTCCQITVAGATPTTDLFVGATKDCGVA